MYLLICQTNILVKTESYKKHRNDFWKSINEMVNGGFKNKTKSKTQAVF